MDWIESYEQVAVSQQCVIIMLHVRIHAHDQLYFFILIKYSVNDKIFKTGNKTANINIKKL